MTIKPGEGGPSSEWQKKQKKLAEIADLRKQLEESQAASTDVIGQAEAMIRKPQIEARIEDIGKAIYSTEGELRPAFEGGIPPQSLTEKAEERARWTGKAPSVADHARGKGQTDSSTEASRSR